MTSFVFSMIFCLSLKSVPFLNLPWFFLMFLPNRGQPLKTSCVLCVWLLLTSFFSSPVSLLFQALWVFLAFLIGSATLTYWGHTVHPPHAVLWVSSGAAALSTEGNTLLETKQDRVRQIGREAMEDGDDNDGGADTPTTCQQCRPRTYRERDRHDTAFQQLLGRICQAAVVFMLTKVN